MVKYFFKILRYSLLFIEGARVLLQLLLFSLFEQTYLVLNLLFDGVLLLWDALRLGSVFILHLGLLLLNVLLLFNTMLCLNTAHSFLNLLRLLLLLLIMKKSIIQSFIILLLALYELLHLLLILEHQNTVSFFILLNLWLQCFFLCILCRNHILRRLLLAQNL